MYESLSYELSTLSAAQLMCNLDHNIMPKDISEAGHLLCALENLLAVPHIYTYLELEIIFI